MQNPAPHDMDGDTIVTAGYHDDNLSYTPAQPCKLANRAQM